MKFIYSFFVLLLVATACFSQENQKVPRTNFDEFLAQHGGFVQIEDFPLTRMILELSYGETRIRKVTAESETKIYYQVESGDFIGSVASEDYAALIKAYTILQEQALSEKKNTRDFYINKYVDRGGLEIGYQVERKKLTWFMRPHRFGSRVLYLKDPATMEESLTQGVAMIQKLKQ